MRVFVRLVAFFVVVWLLAPKASAQSQVFPQWTARLHFQNALIGGAGTGVPNSIAADAQGNSFVAQSVCLDRTLNCPDTESLTTKYDADGRLQWKAWLSSPIHRCTSVGVATDAAGNAYVLSVLWLQQDTDSEFATAKYTPNGTRSWIQFFHGATRTYMPFGLAVSPNGNVYVTGTTAAMQRDPDEVLTIKYDTGGNLLWSRTESAFGLIPGQEISGIALDGQEDVFVAFNAESVGFFSAALTKYDKDGHTVPGGTGLGGTINVFRVDGRGNTYVAGEVIPDNANVSPFFAITKADAAGHVVWENDSASGPIGDIKPDSNGNLYVANGVGILEKLDGKGVPLWSSPVAENPVALAVNAFGDVYLADSQSVAKYSRAGTKLWTQPFTGSAAAMTIGGDGALLVTGSATAATGSGNDWITTNYVQDAAKLTPAALSFGNEVLKMQSASQTVTLTNTAEVDLIIKSIPVTGDFHLTNNCPATLAPGALCTLGITFTPTELGARTGTLSVSDNWEGSEHSPQTVKLTGTGVAP